MGIYHQKTDKFRDSDGDAFQRALAYAVEHGQTLQRLSADIELGQLAWMPEIVEKHVEYEYGVSYSFGYARLRKNVVNFDPYLLLLLSR